ncbi:MAG: NAD kinase [Bacteroidales bacterium]
MKIVVYGNIYQERYLEPLIKLFQNLVNDEIKLLIDSDFYEYLSKHISVVNNFEVIKSNDDLKDVNMAISIGGDGTFIRTSKCVALKDIPVLGINTGHLGFLTDYSVDDIDTIVADILGGNFKIETRTLLDVRTDLDLQMDYPYALNEVAVIRQNTSSMITLDTRINNIELTRYMGDGLVVATPSGSTAYNLSVGGPILEPTSKSWAISPIAPHSLNMRPLVVNDDSVLTIKTNSRSAAYRLSIDGSSFTLPIGTTVTIRKAHFTVKVVQKVNHSFAEALRNKLMWGSDKR